MGTGYIVAFSGTHGTGKTTAVYERATELKKAMPCASVVVLNEVAVGSPYPINQQTTPESQAWIFSAQMSRELELISKHDIVVADRTIMDAVAYTKVAGFALMAEAMFQFACSHLRHYRDIQLLKVDQSHGRLVDDGVRSIDALFQADVEKELVSLYRRSGFNIGQQLNKKKRNRG